MSRPRIIIDSQWFEILEVDRHGNCRCRGERGRTRNIYISTQALLDIPVLTHKAHKAWVASEAKREAKNRRARERRARRKQAA